jgi:leucyl/phenylalanyl-tRNA--protein transferase
MVVTRFPPPDQADAHGLLALGGDLAVPSLLLAYRSGIFPWPLDDETLAWFSPPDRSLLFYDELRISRSLHRERRKTDLRFSVNQAFEGVIVGCRESRNRKDQGGTWITTEMVEAYVHLHQAGHAHSFESWLDGELVGGIYGVQIGGFFAGESMFYRAPNASKFALWFMLDALYQIGITWIDTQVLNPFLATFGAREVPRNEFLKMMQQQTQSATAGDLTFPKSWQGLSYLPER